MAKELKKIKALYAEEKLFGVSRLMNNIFIQKAISGKLPDCKAISSFIFISSNGDVYPCPFYSKILGNLKGNRYDLKSILSRGKNRKYIEGNT